MRYYKKQTVSEQLVARLGPPAEGMKWCSGYKRPPHQAPIELVKRRGCRCKDCRKAYTREAYINADPRRAYRLTDASRQGEVAPRPGNDGKLRFPSWGYLGDAA